MDIQHFTATELVCDESFRRYCAGTDPDARAFWEEWARQYPHKRAELEEARQLYQVLSGRQGNVQEQAAQLRDGMDRYDLLREAVRLPEVEQVRMEMEAREVDGRMTAGIPAGLRVAAAGGRRAGWRVTGVAAAVLGLCGLGWLLWHGLRAGGYAGSPAAGQAWVYQTGDEPRRTVILADGSVITLHDHTTISLDTGFNRSGRVLRISGEAFFDIAANTALPFVVRTAGTKVEVLGTQFNIRAYPGKGYTETSLLRGKIMVTDSANPGEKILLQPGRKLLTGLAAGDGTAGGGSAGADSAWVGNGRGAGAGGSGLAGGAGGGMRELPLTQDPSDHQARELAWVRNRLKIADEPLEKIARRLEDWYGIPIVFTDDAVKGYRYTGTFENETVVKALEALQLSYPFHFRTEADRILIGK